MSAYLVLLLAVLSRLLPHALHSTALNFTAVGGGLLFFGARRSRWQAIFAVLALMATDYYLTVYAYGYPFRPSAYVITWAWYGAVCLLGYQMLRGKSAGAYSKAKETSAPSGLRVAGAVLATSTSFFLLSNFMVWSGGTMYVHSASGLATCYIAAIPFYANDLLSTGLTAGALFGLPALARSIALNIREMQNNQHPLA